MLCMFNPITYSCLHFEIVDYAPEPETSEKVYRFFFYVLLTVHLSIFVSVFNQLDAQNLFHNKFYFMPLHVLSTCAHHQEVKIALHL